MTNETQQYTTLEQAHYYLIKRFLLKGVLPFAVAAAIAYATGDPRWTALTPFLMTLEKFLRDQDIMTFLG